jgi:hypothetical protein
VIDTEAEMFRSAVFDPVLRASVGEARVLVMFENYLEWIESRDLPGGALVFARRAFQRLLADARA